jgi:hypothetical protein
MDFCVAVETEKHAFICFDQQPLPGTIGTFSDIYLKGLQLRLNVVKTKSRLVLRVTTAFT